MRNLARNRNISSAQIDVERNQKRARAHSNRAGRFMDTRLARVRRTLRIEPNLLAQLFKAALPHLL